jgi:FAD-dependent urate hydroxylase
MTDTVDVAIVGAGPYGLSLGAHLHAAGVSFRQFGVPMGLWRNYMPKGMNLKSQGFASNLSSPDGEHTLEAFCAATGHPYASYGLPVTLDNFVSYGMWFKDALVPELEEKLVTDLSSVAGSYELTLDSGEKVRAAKVVVAAGVEHFASMPESLGGLASSLCSHSSQHTDLGVFENKSVMVLGAGQSALESAALLHESGAKVLLVARKNQIRWNGKPLPLDRPLLERLREPEAGLGSGWATWFYSNYPDVFRHLPEATRITRARTALGPAGAPWLRPRVDGPVETLLGHSVQWVKADGANVIVGLEESDGTSKEITTDHIMAATGYRTNLERLGFLGPVLRPRLELCAGTPVVDSGYQSSVPGLYFIGPAVAPTFGPVMRFVFGSAHAAHTVAGRLGARDGRRRSRPVVGTRR